MQKVEDFLNSLRQEGESAGIGFFSLDRDKAREKMKKYQLVHPYLYVLEIIQAACASGAKGIEVYIDSDDFKISFDGKPYTREELENIYSSLFISQKDINLDRLRKLAIGLNSAQDLKPRYIIVKSGDSQNTMTMKILQAQTDTFDYGPPGIQGTSIHVRERVGMRTLGKFLSKVYGRIFYSSSQTTEEGRIIEERCRYISIPLTINGKCINKEIELGETLMERTIDEADISGKIGLPLFRIEKSKIVFLKHGVIITEKEESLNYVQIVGVVRADHLVNNASQTDIVDNEEYRNVWKRLRKYSELLIEDLIRRYSESEADTESGKSVIIEKEARKYFFFLMREHIKANAYSPKIKPLKRAIAQLKLFTTIQGDQVSLHDLIEQYRRIGYVPYFWKMSKLEIRDNIMIIYLREEQQLDILRRIFENVKTADKLINEAEKRKKRKRLWQVRSFKPVLSDARYLARMKLENGLEGEMGILDGPVFDTVSLSLYKNYSPIGHEIIDVYKLHFTAVVNNDSLNPVFTWDAIEKDEVFEETVNHLLQNLDCLYQKLVSLYIKSHNEKARIYLLRYLDYLIGKVMGDIPERWSLTPSPKRVKKTLVVDTIISGRFVNLPLFRTVLDRLVSIIELKEVRNRLGHIPFIDCPSVCPEMDEVVLSVSNDAEKKVLERYFPQSEFVDYTEKLSLFNIARKNKSRPQEDPVLKGDFLAKISLIAGDINGEIGIPSSSNISYPAYNNPYTGNRPFNQSYISRIRVLKNRRFIVEKAIALVYGAVVGVVNYDDLKVNFTYDDIAEEAEIFLLKGFLEDAMEKLAQEITRNLERTGEIGRRFILKYIVGKLEEKRFLKGKSDYVSQHGEDILETLKVAPIFNTLKGEKISFNDLVRILDSQNMLLVDMTHNFKSIPGDIEVLRSSLYEKQALINVFGYFKVQDYDKSECEDIQSLYVPKIVEKLEVDAETALSIVSIDSGGVKGEIGIFRGFDGVDDKSRIRMLKERVDLGVKEMKLGACVTGIVNYDKLTPLFRGGSVVEDKNYKFLISVISKEIERLILLVLQNYEGFSEDDRNTINLHLLYFFAGSLGAKSIGEVKAPSGTEIFPEFMNALKSQDTQLDKEKDAIGQKIYEIPMFSRLGGGKVSIADLKKNYDQFGKVFFVERAGEGEPLDDEKIVIVVSRGEKKQLARIFTWLYDYEADLKLDKIARKNMSRQKLSSLEVPRGSVLIYKKIKYGNMHGEIALPLLRAKRGGVIFSKNMIPVVEKEISDDLNVAGIIENPDFTVNRTWDDVELTVEQKSNISYAVFMLFKILCSKFEKGMVKKANRGLARDYLLDYLLTKKDMLLYGGSSGLPDVVVESVMGLEMIETYDGRTVSIYKVLDIIKRKGKVYFVFPDEKVKVPAGIILLKLNRGDYLKSFFDYVVGEGNFIHFPPMLFFEGGGELEIEALGKEKGQGGSEDRVLPETASFKAVPQVPEEVIPVKESFSFGEKAITESFPGVHELELQEKLLIPGELVLGRQLSPQEVAEISQLQAAREKLLLNVKREFQIIREIDDYKLGNKILEGIRFGYCDRDEVVRFNPSTTEVIINLSNPSVLTILSNYEIHPGLIYYLISSIYSVINFELEEVTDEYEMKFQTKLMENYLKQ